MKMAVSIVIGIVIAAITAVIVIAYQPAATTPAVKSDESQQTVDVTSGGEKVAVQQVLQPIWKEEHSRDFDNNTFTIRVVKTAYTAKEYPIDDPQAISNGYQPVQFTASIRVTNHFNDQYVTYDQKKQVSGSDWTTTTFDGIEDSHTLFVYVTEDGKPIQTLQVSGRGAG